jgi:putative peptidoglycan lipid II flippase
VTRPRHEKPLAPTTLLVAVVLALGSLAAIVRDALVAARYGATGDADAYFFGTYVVIVIVTVLVSESAAPASMVALARPGASQRARGSALRALLLAGGLLCAVSLLVALAAPGIVRLAAPGFDGATRRAAVDVVVAVAPAIALLGLAWLVGSYLAAAGRYVVPALLMPIVAAGACLPFFFGTPSPRVASLGWTIGSAAAAGFFLIWALRAARSGDVNVVLNRAAIDRAATLMLPLLLLAMVQGCAEIADRLIASQLGAGSVTSITLAKKAIHLPSAVLVAAIGVVALPYLSRRQSGHDRRGAFVRTLNLSIFFLLPCAAAIVLMRDELVELVFLRGAFGRDDARVTAGLLGLYALALIPVNLGVILQRSFATLDAGHVILRPYAVAISTYVASAWLLSRQVGLIALPIAFGLAEAGYVVALLVALHRRVTLALPPLLWPAGVVVVATASAAAALVAVDRLAPVDTLPQVVLQLLAASGVYVIVVSWLGHPTVEEILGSVRRRAGDAPSDPPLRVVLDMTLADRQEGASQYLASLARELERLPELALIRCRAARFARLPRPVRVPINGLLHVFWIQVMLPLLAWRHRADVIHATLPGPLLAPCPVVVTLDKRIDYVDQRRPSRIRSAHIQTIGAAARRADAILTFTHAGAADVAARYRVSPDRVQIMPYGGALHGCPPEPSCCAGSLPRRYVLLVDTAERRQNLETALAAVARVRATGDDVGVVVVGTQPHSSANVPWLRALSDVSDAELRWLYEHAEALVVSSRGPGVDRPVLGPGVDRPVLGPGVDRPVLEALAAGTPVVASDVPALREVAGDGARFASPNDPEAFARELRAILRDPRAERARIRPARSRAIATAQAAAVAQTCAVYRSVVHDHHWRRAWLSTAVS